MSGMGEKVRAGRCRIRGSANPTPRQPTPCWNKHHNGEPERLVVSGVPRQDVLNPGRAASSSLQKSGGHNRDRKSTRLNYSPLMRISYAVFCLKKNIKQLITRLNTQSN